MDVAEILGKDGLLSEKLDGFQWRDEQQKMAEAVAATLEKQQTLVCEAGTGTGKTFAYLVPALMSGLKVLVSTGTKNLQDQLFNKDLPIIRDLLDLPISIALLKGRGNYLCPHRLAITMHDQQYRNKEIMQHLRQIRQWSTTTKSGDINEIGVVPEGAMVWPQVTSTTENCLGQDCPSINSCFLLEARKKAQEADIVVINHHLLCADMALKDGGFGELLPDADAFIIDEAHQLPDVASNFFGSTISSRQLLDLTRDTEAEYYNEAGDLPKLLEQISAVSKATRDLRLAFGVDQRREAWDLVADDKDVQDGVGTLLKQLSNLLGMLESQKDRGKGLASCYERADAILKDLTAITSNDADEDLIRWFETTRAGFRFNSTPLEISDLFGRLSRQRGASWIFTSATLAVGGKFGHFQAQLGISADVKECWDSPFDYPNQALWFVPKGMPKPSQPLFSRKVSELVLELIELSKGRAFILFTSHRALRDCADYLENKTQYKLLVQGSASKAELIDTFRTNGNAVLLGTSSFWEGVDVRGEALSLVVIDKLPFASPGDPVMQARLDLMKSKGFNPFMHFQVPQAAIALKQGSGRLIRDVSDRGVLVICDPRLLKRGYGQTFLDSMPPMARTRNINDVAEFFK